jgi:hypothetical protein
MIFFWWAFQVVALMALVVSFDVVIQPFAVAL